MIIVYSFIANSCSAQLGDKQIIRVRVNTLINDCIASSVIATKAHGMFYRYLCLAIISLLCLWCALIIKNKYKYTECVSTFQVHKAHHDIENLEQNQEYRKNKHGITYVNVGIDCERTNLHATNYWLY